MTTDRRTHIEVRDDWHKKPAHHPVAPLPPPGIHGVADGSVDGVTEADTKASPNVENAGQIGPGKSDAAASGRAGAEAEASAGEPEAPATA